jgi:hypothetical protein
MVVTAKISSFMHNNSYEEGYKGQVLLRDGEKAFKRMCQYRKNDYYILQGKA